MTDKSYTDDGGPDDTYTEGDEDIDWSNVEVVAEQIDAINAIDDPAERLAAAKAWAAELGGA